jgi:HEAT repeat protein
MEYVAIPKFTGAEMEKAVAEDDMEKLLFVPLFASLYYEDRNYAEEICIKLAHHSNSNVRATAIEGFEHLARIDGKLNKEIVKPIIEKALKDKNEFVRRNADETKAATEHFLKWNYNK